MTRRLLIVTALLASIVVLAALARVTGRPPGTIATLDTLRLMERMLELPEFAQARDAKITEYQTPLIALDAQLRTMIDQWSQLDPASPEASAIRTQAEQVQQQLSAGQQNAQLGIDAFAAEQFANAFRQIRAQASAIATERGYQYVMTSRFDDEQILTDSTSLFVQEILYRSALIAPEGTDITQAVADALNLPEPAPSPEPAVGPTPDLQPTPAPTGTPDP